jgi:hypothetical protein
VLDEIAFPLVPPLRSIDSAAGCPALFADFSANTGGSDWSRPCITGFDLVVFPARASIAGRS